MSHVRTFRHYLLSVVFPDTPPVNTSTAFGDLNSEWRRLLAYHLGLREAHIEQVARSHILTDPTLLNTTFSAIVVDHDTDSSNEDEVPVPPHLPFSAADTVAYWVDDIQPTTSVHTAGPGCY